MNQEQKDKDYLFIGECLHKTLRSHSEWFWKCDNYLDGFWLWKRVDRMAIRLITEENFYMKLGTAAANIVITLIEKECICNGKGECEKCQESTLIRSGQKVPPSSRLQAALKSTDSHWVMIDLVNNVEQYDLKCLQNLASKKWHGGSWFPIAEQRLLPYFVSPYYITRAYDVLVTRIKNIIDEAGNRTSNGRGIFTPN